MKPPKFLNQSELLLIRSANQLLENKKRAILDTKLLLKSDFSRYRISHSILKLIYSSFWLALDNITPFGVNKIEIIFIQTFYFEWKCSKIQIPKWTREPPVEICEFILIGWLINYYIISNNSEPRFIQRIIYVRTFVV